MAFFSHKEIDSWTGEYKETNIESVGYTGAVAGILESTAVVLGGREVPGEDLNESSLVILFDLVKEKIVYDYDVQGSLSRHRIALLPSKSALFVFGGEAITGDHLCYQSLDDLIKVTLQQHVLTFETVPPRGNDDRPQARAWHTLTTVKYRAAVDAGIQKATKGQAITPSVPVGEAEDALLLLGGRSSFGGQPPKDLWIYATDKPDDVDATVPITKWFKLPAEGASPLPLAHHSAEPLHGGEKIIVFGGIKGASSHFNDAISVLDLSTGVAVWSTLATSPAVATCYHVAAFLHLPVSDSGLYFPATPPEPSEAIDRLVVFGGVGAHGPAPRALFHALDPLTGAVDAITGCLALQSAVGHAAVSSLDRRKLYIFGGTPASPGLPWRNATSVLDFWRYQYEPAPDMSRFEKIRTFEYPNGDVYIGELDPDTDIRRGLGRCTYSDGRVYEGHWADDTLDGAGVMNYANGDVYDGSWLRGMRDGQGKLTMAPPSTAVATVYYDGAWKQDKRHGPGALGYSDGSVLRGTWVADAFETACATIDQFVEGTAVGVYEGEVDAATNLPHGSGRFETLGYPKTGEMYSGHWAAGKRNGIGMCMLYDGTIYQGEWKNGKKNGFGSCDYARSRDRYEGKWVGGQRCGQGKCTYAAGYVYEGHWAADQRHGRGRCTYTDGTFYEGQWKGDDFCGDGALVLNAATPRT
ncbi:hypothetical protein ACHHYP_05648 [Achlya hypogyna]|uniref:Uncharacterized protein n=1 Tax=Achlya hypogyna TaxID=1202772 RepID=A0A1V9YWV2_ACHHY|nr:hypothetical protein ACHHYP_05648 [Achlya hypogyna]